MQVLPSAADYIRIQYYNRKVLWQNRHNYKIMLKEFTKGMKSGIPIALGYLSVSFTFGLIAVSSGLSWWQATLISMTNLTSAGQFAGLDIMVAMGSFFEMAAAQFVINIRYSLMSISLTQKVDSHFGSISRALLGFGITDEIFAVAASRPASITRPYLSGLIITPYIGWSIGTLFGALMGDILPSSVVSALGIAIYAMFIAIIIPVAKEDRNILKVVLLAIVLSCTLKWVPGLSSLSSGFSIILCSVIASAVGALLFPLPDESDCP